EVERVDRTIRGIAVHTTARIAALAAPGEVLVSSTVKDLVAGSGLAVEDRGGHTLQGVPEPRPILAVSGGGWAMRLPTTVIGSLPRPGWVRDVILDRKAGRLDGAEADRLLDAAVDGAIRLQERAGLDEITDGEWRRESYVKVFAERVRGFEPDLIQSVGPSYPAVVAPIAYHREIAAPEVRYVRARTRRRVKATLPSPYILGRRMWHPEHSRRAYPTRERFMADCVGVLRQELEAVRAAGAD